MQGNYTAFCNRQFAKILILANDATDTSDPVLKDDLLQMAQYWRTLATDSTNWKHPISVGENPSALVRENNLRNRVRAHYSQLA
jgi:hypothetical protein